jgi:hypothetical protein
MTTTVVLPLPLDRDADGRFQALGFRFGAIALGDARFRHVELPPRWTMSTNGRLILDQHEQARVRVDEGPRTPGMWLVRLTAELVRWMLSAGRDPVLEGWVSTDEAVRILWEVAANEERDGHDAQSQWVLKGNSGDDGDAEFWRRIAAHHRLIARRARALMAGMTAPSQADDLVVVGGAE